MTKKSNFTAGIFFLLLFISIIGGGVILKLTAAVCIPVVVAVLLSFVFLPLVKRLNEKPFRLPWGWAIFLVFVLFIALFIVVGNIIAASFSKIIDALPRYEERFMTIFQKIALEFNLPFDENSFDVVICSQSFHHYPDPQAFFNSVYKVLRPNGRLILRDITAPDPLRWIMNTIEMPIVNLTGHGDVKIYGKKDVQNFCENAGLKMEICERRGFLRLHSVARKPV